MECTHYIPHQRDKIPGAIPLQYNASNLPLHTHEEFLRQADAVKMGLTNTAHDKLAKKYGTKGRPVLSYTSALSFPFDFMHFIWENLIPNLILFWTGNLKDLNHQGRGYVIKTHIWKEIGAATEACYATIPAAFGASIPNIAVKGSVMTAEMWANWTLYIAPVVLCERFKKDKYYKHFLKLVKLLKLCLLFEINEAMLSKMKEGFKL